MSQSPHLTSGGLQEKSREPNVLSLQGHPCMRSTCLLPGKHSLNEGFNNGCVVGKNGSVSRACVIRPGVAVISLGHLCYLADIVAM
jgi:hypothetical protein